MEIAATGSVPNVTPGLRPPVPSPVAPAQAPESSQSVPADTQSRPSIPATQQTTPAAEQTSGAQPAATPSSADTEQNPSSSQRTPEDPRGPQPELSGAERRQIQELRTRDRQVRAHEQAHLAAGGSIAKRAPSFEFTVGPDGRRYAVGGEVAIDASRVAGDPEATIRKAQAIRRAALAPADPSAQDQRVAAQATRMEQQARTELLRQQGTERSEGEETGTQAAQPALPGTGSTETPGSASTTGRLASPASEPGVPEAIPADELNSAPSLPPGQRIDIFA